MKLTRLIASAVIPASLLFAPHALAEGKPGCSDPCVVDEDATTGDLTSGTDIDSPSVYHVSGAPALPKPKHPASFGPILETEGAVDGDAFQDAPSFNNVRGSW